MTRSRTAGEFFDDFCDLMLEADDTLCRSDFRVLENLVLAEVQKGIKARGPQEGSGE